jgi:hypothetical protein
LRWCALYGEATRCRRGWGLWSVATRIVGKDHEPSAGITQTYEARAIPAKPWFRVFVESVRIAYIFRSYGPVRGSYVRS